MAKKDSSTPIAATTLRLETGVFRKFDMSLYTVTRLEKEHRPEYKREV